MVPSKYLELNLPTIKKINVCISPTILETCDYLKKKIDLLVNKILISKKFINLMISLKLS